MTASWYTIVTRPLGENVAAVAVEREGFRVFLPRCRERAVAHSGKAYQRETLMFPGYLFARIDPKTKGCWRVCRAPGVTRLLSIAGRPAAIPDEVIIELRERVNEGDGAIDLWRPFRLHDRLCVTSGHFEGRTGRYLWSAANRIAMLMEIAYGAVVVEIENSAVTAAA